MTEQVTDKLDGKNVKKRSPGKLEITWRCGHDFEVPKNISGAPRCPACGEGKIVDVRGPSPKIRGHATGPHCKTEHLGGRAMPMTPAGPLLKPNATE
jgi:DNA-directed RNA polymerase subunit RPC12/RpoP